jgi:RHH-type rel operon transcriptional repressor/antitoxin RelB
MLAIRLPFELEQRLEHLATITHRSKSFYAREAISKYIDDLEDIYVSFERLEKPSNKKWSLEELESGDDIANPS